jgi:hypothetical protein
MIIFVVIALLATSSAFAPSTRYQAAKSGSLQMGLDPALARNFPRGMLHFHSVIMYAFIVIKCLTCF